MQLEDLVEAWAKEHFKYVEFSFKGGFHLKVRKYGEVDGVKILHRVVKITPTLENNTITLDCDNRGYVGHGGNHVKTTYDIRDPECFLKMYNYLTSTGINKNDS
jgi:hypothetical protein